MGFAANAADTMKRERQRDSESERDRESEREGERERREIHRPARYSE